MKKRIIKLVLTLAAIGTVSLQLTAREVFVYSDAAAAIATGEQPVNQFRIVFPYGVGNLEESLGRNSTEMKAIKDLVRTNRDDFVFITAFASQEGDAASNLRLSGKRAAAVKDYLVSQGFSVEQIITRIAGEDWDGLCEYVDSHDFPDKAKVQRILNDASLSSMAKKSALYGINGGSTWDWLVNNVMPSLRSVEVSVFSKESLRRLSRGEMTVSEAHGPVGEEAKPAAGEQKPVVEETKPVVEEQKPVVEETKPVVEEQKPAKQDSKPTSEATSHKPATISGTVSDRYGEPLIGASIVDKSGKYALTDNDGNFTLSGINFPATVTVSFIGFDDKVFTINGTEASPITLTMDTENTMLEETVVVGYGTQKKVNLTGAVGVIDGKDLNARPVTNTAMAIQGADPSLVLTQGSGSLDGGSYNFNIRGKLSINSGSPLVLVDGIEGTLVQVNPNDIESVSVLKDASACAIYGTKASAGVILITTKSGQSGEAKITYNGRYSISQNTTSTDFITDGYDYVTLCNDFYSVNKGHNAFTYSDEQMEMLRERHGDVTENPARPWVIPDATGVNTYVYLANYDWYSFLFKRTRPETEHNVTVRGGTDKVKYYASVRYLYREGVFNGNASDALNNISLRGKVDAKMTSWLDFSTNVSLLRSNYKWGGYMEMDGSTDLNSQGIMWNLTQNVSPTYVPFNPDGTVAMVPDFMADATSPLMSGRAGAFLSDVNHNENKNNYWTWTNRLTAHITKWLDFSADYSYRRRDRQSTNRMNPTPNSYDNSKKRMYVGNGLSGGYFSNGSIYDYFREYNYYQDGNVANAWFNFHNTFGKNHNVSATLGANFDDYYSRSVTLEQKGSLSDKLSYINLTDGEIQKAIDAVSAYRTLGFFGRLNYDFAGRYLFEVSGRYDGSSRFPEGQRWAFFPSFSAGWRVSEEPFWASIKPVVSYFKIRASYGTLGNQQVDNYYYWDTISTGTLGGYTFDGLTKAGYANASSPKSSNLTWETVVSKNLGLDLGFLRNRLTITADFFIRDTKNMLTKAMTLPDVYGETAPKENAADLQTRGYEIALSWKDNFKLAGKPFYYGVSASLGDFRTWITRFDNPDKILSDNYVGKELGEIWGYTTDGLFATDEEAAEYEATYNSSIVNKGIFDAVAPYNHLMAGDIKYRNLDDNPAINTATNTLDDPGDRAVIGNSRPRYNYSFKGDLSWAGLDISVFFQGVGKMDWMPSSYCSYFWGPYAYQRPTFIPKNFRDNCWSAEPGADNSKAFFPRQRGLIAGSSNLVTSDYWLQNAAYLRLKNLTIGYTLPLPKNKVLEKARIYFSGENLFYWSPLKKVTKYVDPEVATNSATRDIMYPYSKTFSFGVDITF